MFHVKACRCEMDRPVRAAGRFFRGKGARHTQVERNVFLQHQAFNLLDVSSCLITLVPGFQVKPWKARG